MRKLLTFVALMLVMTVLSGCALVQVNPDRDREQVLATFNDQEILKGEVMDIYDRQKEMWGITPEVESDPQYAEALMNVKIQILDNLIDERIIEAKATEAGFVVEQLDIDKARVDFMQQLQSHAEMLLQQTEEAEREGIDFEQRAREVFDSELEAMGLTEDAYLELMAQQRIVEEFRVRSLEAVAVTDEQIQTYYDEQLVAQQADPAAAAQEVTLLTQPGARVKHILIGLSDEQGAEYRRLRNEGLNDEADVYLEESLASIRPEAEALLERARAGEEFEALIATYGDDPGMIDNEEGYTVRRNGQMIPQFEEASLALANVGDISDLVGGQFGYHIIKLYESLEGNVFTLEETREEIEALLLERNRETEWNRLLEQWRTEANIQRFVERI